jgi:hypothetical protein
MRVAEKARPGGLLRLTPINGRDEVSSGAAPN